MNKFSCRVAAVWTTEKSELKMRVAVALVVSVFAYSLVTGIVSSPFFIDCSMELIMHCFAPYLFMLTNIIAKKVFNLIKLG